MTYAIIAGSAMIAFIAVLRLLFLRCLPKQCFRVLWILAALRLLLPFSLTYEVELWQTPIAEHQANGLQTVILDAQDAIKTAEIASPSFEITNAIRVILPLGTLISGGFLTLAYLKMSRLAKSGRLIRRDVKSGADIRTGDGVGTPFSCGAFRPIIFIPSSMLQLDLTQLDIIISHERQHVRSRDQLVKWLIAAAVCLNWYNPLVWLMWCLSSRDIELACDEAVVRGGRNNADYALTLIGAEELRSTKAVCSFGAPLLNERIECIMRSKKITVCGFISAALILTAASAFFVQVTAAKANDDLDAENGATLVENVAIADTTAEPVGNGSEYDATKSESECEISDEIILVPTSFELTSPLAEHGEITGHFGEYTNPVGVTIFNNGVNVAAAMGTSVYAAASGTVVTAEYDAENGNYIVVEHTNGSEIYRHLGEIFVSVGDEVEVGYEIGTVGSTGRATGPNLGFSVIREGAYVSPEALFE